MTTHNLRERMARATEKLDLQWLFVCDSVRDKAVRARDARHEQGWYCPVTAICEAETGERFTSDHWTRAAARAGLSTEDGIAIVTAADLDGARHVKSTAALRATMEEFVNGTA